MGKPSMAWNSQISHFKGPPGDFNGEKVNWGLEGAIGPRNAVYDNLGNLMKVTIENIKKNPVGSYSLADCDMLIESSDLSFKISGARVCKSKKTEAIFISLPDRYNKDLSKFVPTIQFPSKETYFEIQNQALEQVKDWLDSEQLDF